MALGLKMLQSRRVACSTSLGTPEFNLKLDATK
jgi:hypothetical protein